MGRLKKAKAPRAHAFNCHYCGVAVFEGQNRTWDHIVPKALGGSNAAINLVTSCQPCNTAKGHSMPTCECAFCKTAVNYWRGRKRSTENRARSRTTQPVLIWNIKAPPAENQFVSMYRPNPRLKFEPPPPPTEPESESGSPFYPNY